MIEHMTYAWMILIIHSGFSAISEKVPIHNQQETEELPALTAMDACDCRSKWILGLGDKRCKPVRLIVQLRKAKIADIICIPMHQEPYPYINEEERK